MQSIQSSLLLMQLSDAALPTGAFSHSLGLETYVSAEQVRNAENYEQWLKVLITEQLTYTDALAVRLAMRKPEVSYWDYLTELISASTLSEETRSAGLRMGYRLLELVQLARENGDTAWKENTPHPGAFREYLSRVQGDSLRRTYPSVVWGALCAELGCEEDHSVAQHLYATVLSLTQNAVRGIPIGPDTGQKVAARARVWVQDAVQISAGLEEEDLGITPLGLEIAQMRHKDLRARMFMS